MPRPRRGPSTPRQARRGVLRGASKEQVRGAIIELRAKTQGEKAANYRATIARLRALAADPHLIVLAERVDAATDAEPGLGGRPRANPTWAMLLFMEAISIFGSASAVERELRDADVWEIMCRATKPNLPADAALPSRTPTRHHYLYFTERLARHQVPLTDWFAELAAQRAGEVGLADQDSARLSRAEREHTLGIDAKVHSSPVGTLASEIVDKRTGEIRRRRDDPARGAHREGGTSDLVYGTKVAYSSVRSPLPGHRVITGVQHVPPRNGRGEAGAFVDLATASATALPGLTHLVADGAMRGTHIDAIQTTAGLQVVSPPRRRTGSRGGIKINEVHYAGKPLPASKARDRAFTVCEGHDLWAAGGGIHERIIAADGTETLRSVERGQLKRQRKPDGAYQMLALHRLPCGQMVHEWWEPLTSTAANREAGFNRCEYLRALPADHPDYPRVYGMRADTESFHAELEYAFHKQRLPAYGVHRQMLVLLGAALAQNAWALHVFHREHNQQSAPPGAAS